MFDVPVWFCGFAAGDLAAFNASKQEVVRLMLLTNIQSVLKYSEQMEKALADNKTDAAIGYQVGDGDDVMTYSTTSGSEVSTCNTRSLSLLNR